MSPHPLMQTITSFILGAFVAYGGAWYLGFGATLPCCYSGPLVSGLYWLAERFHFLPQRIASPGPIGGLGPATRPNSPRWALHRSMADMAEARPASWHNRGGWTGPQDYSQSLSPVFLLRSFVALSLSRSLPAP